MKILMLSWRDIRHPMKGGAEVLTLELARRWVHAGHEVTWFAAAFEGCAPEEEIEGVRVIRQGRAWTVQWHAYRRLRREQFDMVVDQVNTLPFMTPLYVRGPRIALFHQLCREIWFYERSWPLSLVGYLAEPLYLQAYRSTAVMAVSDSTRASLARLGIKRTHVVHPGINTAPTVHPMAKNGRPSFVFVGRLVKSKRADHALRAFAHWSAGGRDGVLNIVGDGPQKNSLTRLARELGVEQQVMFHGYTSAAQKQELMARSHAILVTSVREGWGLIVSEANALGTPAIVYDVPGLRDSVRHGLTGLITDRNDPTTLAGLMASLLDDDRRYSDLQRQAIEWSQTLSLDEAARRSLNILEEQVLAYTDSSVGDRTDSQQRRHAGSVPR